MTPAWFDQMSLKEKIGIILIICGLIMSFFKWICGFFKNKLSSRNRRNFSKRWNKIRQLFDADTTRPLAIIDANSLLEDALKKRGYSDGTIHQRLEKARRLFTNIQEVQNGIHLRNKLVHETNMTPYPEADMRRALQGFRQALVDLGAL